MTLRYSEMEMCMEWGVTPDRYDALPHPTRVEMRAFWQWRGQRLLGARRAAEFAQQQRLGKR